MDVAVAPGAAKTNDSEERLQVDLCCDLGEGFANYRSGDDASIIPLLSSANVACGFHAGDPRIMERSVALAREHGVAVGAHPGLPDLLGFGRRRMSISPDDCRTYTLYQLGALDAFLRTTGGRLHHVAPHGAFWDVITHDPVLSRTFCEAIRVFDPELILFISVGEEDLLPAAAAEAGLRVSPIYCADLEYDSRGMLTIEREKQPKIPADVAERAVQAIKSGYITASTGERVRLSVGTILLHGDGPNSLDVIAATRSRLEAEGIRVSAP
jgi:UPF0271 protein